MLEMKGGLAYCDGCGNFVQVPVITVKTRKGKLHLCEDHAKWTVMHMEKLLAEMNTMRLRVEQQVKQMTGAQRAEAAKAED